MRAALRANALAYILFCCALHVAHASSRARGHAPRPTTLRRAALRESSSVLIEGEYRLNAKQYKPLAKWQVVALTQVIEWLIDQSKVRDGTHPFLAGFVRVAFHDCVGISCDGCINQQQVHNKGLVPYIKALDDTYRTHKMRIHEWMSQADFWALAGIVAARRGARKGGQTLTTEFRAGRVDCHTSPNTPVEDDFPDPHGDTATTLDYWVNRFSLTYYETTALLGAHGLGKCHLDASGFDGPWTEDKDLLDNEYYQDLMNGDLNWRQVQISKEHVQWMPGDTDATHMMLNADMALWKKIEPSPRISGCSYATCERATTAATVQAFATDNALFIHEFSKVFQKLIEHGLEEPQATEGNSNGQQQAPAVAATPPQPPKVDHTQVDHSQATVMPETIRTVTVPEADEASKAMPNLYQLGPGIG